MAFIPHRLFVKPDVALDMGTATIRVATGSCGLMARPSVMGMHHALRAGVVIDIDVAIAVLKPLLAQTRGFGIVKPRVVTCSPSDATRDERDLLVESVIKAGASSVVVVPEPLAAAVGAGVDVASPYAQMVIDIGEGVTDCAIIRSGMIQATSAIRVGCARMRQAIMDAARLSGHILITEDEAERLIRTVGVYPCGRTNLPGGMGDAEVISAVEPVMAKMLATIDSFLRDVPENLGCEVIESGIWLTGGGALIPGMCERIEEKTGITVDFANNPLEAVVEGARTIMPLVSALNQWEQTG